MSWKHPTKDAVMAIHTEVLRVHSGGEGLRSVELLESAIAAPQASIGGAPILTDGLEVAAAYLYYLCSNHPFVDGNKRVALATCLVFLIENELINAQALDIDKWETFTLEVAASKLDRKQTTSYLKILIEEL